MVKVKHDITPETKIEEKPFMTRVYGMPIIFPDVEILAKSWVGVSREIGRQRSAQYKEVEPGIIEMKKKNIAKLRQIRKELKKLTNGL